MNRAQRIFTYLYFDLCMLSNQQLQRYTLWLEIGEQGIDPTKLTKEQALFFLEEKASDFLDRLFGEGSTNQRRLNRMIKAFRQWDVDSPNAEEIFTRLGGEY